MTSPAARARSTIPTSPVAIFHRCCSRSATIASVSPTIQPSWVMPAANAVSIRAQQQPTLQPPANHPLMIPRAGAGAKQRLRNACHLMTQQAESFPVTPTTFTRRRPPRTQPKLTSCRSPNEPPRANYLQSRPVSSAGANCWPKSRLPSLTLDSSPWWDLACTSSSGAAQSNLPSASSKEIDSIIKGLRDWRGETLAQLRASIKRAFPSVVEDVKWKKPSNPAGVPIWSREGIVCIGDALKNSVRLTFPKGALIADPKKLFNARLDSRTNRAIDVREDEVVNDAAFAALIRDAVRLNVSKVRRR
jgi:hypothetical protein